MFRILLYDYGIELKFISFFLWLNDEYHICHNRNRNCCLLLSLNQTRCHRTRL